jgi:hypothetical protein
MTNEELIAAFLAKGGTVTKCRFIRPLAMKRRSAAPTPEAVERELGDKPIGPDEAERVTVYVPTLWIARAETWLRENGLSFRTALWATRGKGYGISFPERRSAMLFKIWWSNAIRNAL